MGPLTEGEPECPWCGFNPDATDADKGPSYGAMALYVVLGLMCIALLLLVMGYPQPPTTYHTTVQLAIPEMTDRTVDDEVRWDTMITVNKVTPKDDLHSWSRVKITIEDVDGKAINHGLALQSYNESDVDDGSDGTIDVQAWYVDDTEHPGRLSAGDDIVITGMSRLYEGCVIKVEIKDNHGGGSTPLPDEFE